MPPADAFAARFGTHRPTQGWDAHEEELEEGGLTAAEIAAFEMSRSATSTKPKARVQASGIVSPALAAEKPDEEETSSSESEAD